MILVVGATGSLGRQVVKKLVAQGETVRAMTRDRSKADDLKARGAQIVLGDLRDPESLEFAVRGTKAVVAAAHGMLGRGSSSSAAIDDKGHRDLIDAAKAAGTEHFVYTSAVGASADHPIDFWRTKAKIERYLEDSGVTNTIIRPTSFMEIYAWELIGKQVAAGKRVMLLGPGTNPRNYIAADDVANAVVLALRIPELRGRMLEVGGPDNLSPRDVVGVFERVTGRKAKVSSMPLPVVRAAAGTINRVHPGIARIMKASVWGETSDMTFDASLMRTRLPIGLTSLEDFARKRIRA
jgi:NADH dehydrogenase